MNSEQREYNELLEHTKDMNYIDFLEFLKIEVGNFFSLSEYGRTVRHSALKARKSSVKLRILFKIFRQKSIENDKKIKNIMKEAKKEVEKL